MTRSGSFSVLHQFRPTEGHAASLLQAKDGFFYGCTVWPFAAAGSGILYKMAPSGNHFEVLYRFSAVDASGENADGANCYEPLIETMPGVFSGTTQAGGPTITRSGTCTLQFVLAVSGLVQASGAGDRSATSRGRCPSGPDCETSGTACEKCCENDH